MIFICLLFLLPFNLSLKCNYQTVSNCLSCNQTGCAQCQPSFTLSNNQCIKCLANGTQTSNTGCYLCSGSANCEINGCFTGFYFSNNVCMPCPKALNCQNCLSAETCQACLSGFYLNNGLCFNCSLADIYCLECSYYNSQNTCSKCKPEAYLINGACQKCSLSNCEQCDSPFKCLKCVPGYFLLENSCQKCSASYCSYCPNDSCQKCFLNYGVITSQAPYQCLACPLNCESCNDQLTSGQLRCNSCSIGFFNYNGECIACPKNCLFCVSSSTCLECESKFIILKNSSSSLCASTCPSDHHLISPSICVSCTFLHSVYCTKCTLDACLNCSYPTFLLPSSKKCHTCDLIDKEITFNNSFCYRTPILGGFNIKTDKEGGVVLNLDCGVESTIFLYFALDYSTTLNVNADDISSESDSNNEGSSVGAEVFNNILNTEEIQKIKKITLQQIISIIGEDGDEKWNNRDQNDLFWKVFARLETDEKGKFEGFVKADIKFDGFNYFGKFWCKSIEGNLISEPKSFSFNSPYNLGMGCVVTFHTYNIYETSLKFYIGSLLFQKLGLSNMKRVIFTDEGTEISDTNVNIDYKGGNITVTRKNSYVFYIPANWLEYMDTKQEDLIDLIRKKEFFADFSQNLVKNNINITSIDIYTKDESHKTPSFYETIPELNTTSNQISFYLQLKDSDGIISAAIIETESNITNTYETFIKRLPTKELFYKGKNLQEKYFINSTRIYTVANKKVSFQFENLKSNATYDIYYHVRNLDFPNVLESNVFGRVAKTKVFQGGQRIMMQIFLLIFLYYLYG